jgi:hypothetical protein
MGSRTMYCELIICSIGSARHARNNILVVLKKQQITRTYFVLLVGLRFDFLA